MKNATAAIILAHADTVFRKSLLRKCLTVTHYDKIVSTNYPVDIDIQNIADLVIFDKKNPILHKSDYDKHNITHDYWYINSITNEKIYEPFEYEHGYAAYCLIRNGIRAAKIMGYTEVHVINYDYEVSHDELVINSDILNHDYDVIFYDYGEIEYTDSLCSGIFSGKISALEGFFEYFENKDIYYASGGFVLEQKIKSFFENSKLRQFKKSFQVLANNEKTNQEGVLNFSKSHEFNEFKYFSDLVGCDKTSRHEYHKVYPLFVDKFRYETFNIFEIGIDKGMSFHLWEQYFPNAYIYGMDISESFETERGKIFIGDQSSAKDLDRISDAINKCKLIVDDGSHIAEHQLKTFFHLFPKILEAGGVYVIEDIECNYWAPEMTIYGYETGYLNIVDYFTRLNHQISSKYNGINNELDIESISFHANCIVIMKKDIA